jgi:hypothetical protein
LESLQGNFKENARKNQLEKYSTPVKKKRQKGKKADF